MVKAVETRDLVKRYEDVEAIKGISLDIEEGGDLRIPRPERCGKEHDDQGANDAAEEDLRFSDH